MSDVFYSSPLQETGTKRRRGTRNVQKQQAALANAVSVGKEEARGGWKTTRMGSTTGHVRPFGSCSAICVRHRPPFSCPERAIYSVVPRL